jgi:hypothetical protein
VVGKAACTCADLILCIAHRSACQPLIQEFFKFMALKLYFTVPLSGSDSARPVKITAVRFPQSKLQLTLYFFYAMQWRCVKYSHHLSISHTRILFSYLFPFLSILSDYLLSMFPWAPLHGSRIVYVGCLNNQITSYSGGTR